MAPVYALRLLLLIYYLLDSPSAYSIAVLFEDLPLLNINNGIRELAAIYGLNFSAWLRFLCRSIEFPAPLFGTYNLSITLLLIFMEWEMFWLCGCDGLLLSF